MTPSKDTLEAANPAAESAVSQGNSRPTQDASRMRSDAVSLEVPVRVHGSRVTDVVLGTTTHTEPFEEKTTTMIVFPQGGVLKMSTPVASGQMMVVTNLKSGHDAICRVLKVRAFAQGQSYVEIEFTHRQAGYWGVYFPSDGPEAPSPAVPVTPAPPVAAPVSVEVKVEKAQEKPAGDVSWAPASAVKLPAGKPVGQPGKPESLFAPIGSQEDVQPAASATTRVRTNSARDTDRKGLVAEAARRSLLADLPPAAPESPASSLSMAELQGDSQAAPAVSFAGAGVPGEVAEAPHAEPARTAEESAAPFGRLAASASLGGGQAAREPFGSGLSGGTLGISGHAAESGESKSRNWFAIAVSVVGLVAAGAGAAYHMHLPPFAAKSARSIAPASAPAAPPVEVNPHPSSVAQEASPAPSLAVQPNPASSPAMAGARNATAQVTQPAPAKPSKLAQPAATAATASTDQGPAARLPDMFGSLNAHPASRAHSTEAGQADAAPALDASAGNENAELPAIATSPSVALPPPQTEPQGPVRIRVGGAIKPPRLVSSVLPVYPAMARDTGIEGDVVIDTTIDASGNVTGMKVISGPPILRQAALDALRRWKYAPSMLNGDAVPVQMTVTIKFHRQ